MSRPPDAGGPGAEAGGPQADTVPSIRRLPALSFTLVFLTWLGLMAYLWLWSRPQWGWGWALILGTINLTALALLALVVTWLITRAIRRFTSRR